ncbi:MAG TPA: 1,2-phenylacetyl-CoA epoxidase subunit PaaC [Chitinophagaceae bacterium]|nr:1,2-phenylacetyl-CoA epoxidase subunit PaaC [Chitinophagaceae bacterium]
MTDLFKYTVHLADNALILGHRNSEWTGHGPILEQDIAISNIALDLIGQARNFYQYAAQMQEGDRSLSTDVVSEDTLAYLRDAHEFRNCLLVEQPNGDWGATILRQFFFSAYQFYLYGQLQHSKDEMLASIAAKALKEVTYHLRWSAEWVIRLGDGTEESHNRMQHALNDLWKFTGELTQPAAFETQLVKEGISVDLAIIQPLWQEKVTAVLSEATLAGTDAKLDKAWMQTGGKEGRHTEHLGYILAEMQFLQRAYPGSTW